MSRSLGGRNGRSDRGAVAILTAVLIPVLILLTALAVDLGRWYVEAARVQKAADAAALGGVTYMPNNYTSATTTAVAVSGENGFPNTGSSSVSTFKTGVLSELGVTVSSTVNNVFGAIFGNPSTTIARTAVADYQGPAIMGSPCNTFGNEPNSTSTTVSPTGTSIPTVLQGGYATCQSRSPSFWATIEGPQTAKEQGDRYSTRNCGSSSYDGCSGTTNSEYDPNGYFFVVRVGENAKNNPVTVQLFDPAFIFTAVDCESLPSSGIYNGMNPYVPTDAATRYGRSTSSGFCTGDYYPGGGSNSMVTSFVLRNKTLTYNPLVATPISGCTKQFGSYGSSAPTRDTLDDSRSGYRGQVARLLHQWYDLCTFTPLEAGDYYLQVRSSASTSGASAVTSIPDANGVTLVWENGANASSTSATQTTGHGNNAFGIRAFVGSAASQPNAANADVSVAGYQRMPIFQNLSGASNFNLIQVKPDAAGKQFSFDLFDLGDGASGTVTVQPPADSGLVETDLVGCEYKKTLATATYTAANQDSKCKFSFNTTDTNGRVLTMQVPIPGGYNCDGNSPGGCWFKILINRSGSPTDITTWNAAIGGNALRLVQ